MYVFSSSKTALGIWITTEPRFKLRRDGESPSLLGESVLAALYASRQGIPVPEDLRSVGKELLNFVGFKSMSSFEKGASFFQVNLSADEVTIQATTHARGGGFDFLPGEPTKCGVDPIEIGQALVSLSGVGQK